MPYEIETKVLNIDVEKIKQILSSLGAEKILDTRLSVDWFRPKDLPKGEDKWFLRIRTDSSGKSEITWKSKSEKIGITKKVKEISFNAGDPEKAASFFNELGLEKYAHQEKDRVSWKLKDWRFDLDKYPGMPAYLEIEGKSEKHIKEALGLLKLESFEACSDGERTLIETKYGLDWNDMRFKK